jgi:hypothetical protein
MFDDILTPEERNTSETTPLNMDKVMFERSRQIAEVSATTNSQHQTHP